MVPLLFLAFPPSQLALPRQRAQHRMSGVILSSSPPDIPDELYKKAGEHNEHLTRAERIQILERMDVFGLALARPDLLRPEHMNMVLNRPPPDVVSANIRSVTGGKMHRPSELYLSLVADPAGATFDMLDLIFHGFRIKDYTIEPQVTSERLSQSFMRVSRSNPEHNAAVSAAMNMVFRMDESAVAGNQAMMKLLFTPEGHQERLGRGRAAIGSFSREQRRAAIPAQMAQFQRDKEEMAERAREVREEMVVILQREQEALRQESQVN